MLSLLSSVCLSFFDYAFMVRIIQRKAAICVKRILMLVLIRCQEKEKHVRILKLITVSVLCQLISTFKQPITSTSTGYKAPIRNAADAEQPCAVFIRPACDAHEGRPRCSRQRRLNEIKCMRYNSVSSVAQVGRFVPLVQDLIKHLTHCQKQFN